MSAAMNPRAPDIAFTSIPETLAKLQVDAETGLTAIEAESRQKQHGANEVAVQKEHPVLAFLAKFWGLSAWMLELIMILSAVLGKYSDLAVVSVLLVVSVRPVAKKKAAPLQQRRRQKELQ